SAEISHFKIRLHKMLHAHGTVFWCHAAGQLCPAVALVVAPVIGADAKQFNTSCKTVSSPKRRNVLFRLSRKLKNAFERTCQLTWSSWVRSQINKDDAQLFSCLHPVNAYRGYGSVPKAGLKPSGPQEWRTLSQTKHKAEGQLFLPVRLLHHVNVHNQHSTGSQTQLQDVDLSGPSFWAGVRSSKTGAGPLVLTETLLQPQLPVATEDLYYFSDSTRAISQEPSSLESVAHSHFLKDGKKKLFTNLQLLFVD
ncbi:hypothetical protein CEXT_458471, partial [Caerostris extrusa]